MATSSNASTRGSCQVYLRQNGLEAMIIGVPRETKNGEFGHTKQF